MKKTLKQLTSLVLCLLLLAGMMTTVGAETTTVQNLDFSGGINGWNVRNTATGASMTRDASEGDGGAVKLYCPTGKTWFMVYNGPTYYKGRTYTISFKLKADAARTVNYGFVESWSAGIETTPAWATQTYNVTTDWQTFSYTFTINKLQNDADSQAISTLFYLNAVGGTVWVDDYTVTETPCHKATVTVGENGSVTRDGVTVGSETYVTEGETLTLDIVPNTDYDAVVTVDGEEYIPVNNQIVVTPTADTAINVSFVKGNRETTTVQYLDFSGGINGWNVRSAATGASMGRDASEGDGGAVKLYCPTGRTWFMVYNGPTYYKGRTYTISFKLKADAARTVNYGFVEGWSAGIETTPAWATQTYNVTTDWQTFSYTFTINKLQNDAASQAISTLFYLNVVPGTVWVDDYTVTETIYYNDVTVNVGENGSVTKDGEAISSPVKVEKGTSLTLDLVPVSGYQVKAVTVNGAAYTVNNNQIILDSVTEDTVIDVTFEKIPAVAPEIVGGDTSYSWFKAVDGVPTIYTYHKLSAFNTGETDLEYGVKLWNNANAEEKVTLAARSADTGEPVMAEPGAMFAIRAYGTAITSDQTYSVQPYVGDTLGEEMTPKFGE